MKYESFFHHARTILPHGLLLSLEQATRQAMQLLCHGDYPSWQAALDELPILDTEERSFSTPAIRVGSPHQATNEIRQRIKDRLMQLHPWRKGPFSLFGLAIDTEWQSNLKWDRIEKQIEPLTDRRILDIGCGNGYYLFRMLAQHPKLAIGIDPFLLFVMQFHAINRFVQTDKATVLPLGIEALPPDSGWFDTVFSMGVLYHRKNPLEHLIHLAGQLRSGGQLVLETLVIDAPSHQILQPAGRYAKMRNVWNIPSIRTAQDWLKQTGWHSIRVADVTATTPVEQRRTPWMQFESLADFLDPANPGLTCEGYPAPVRALFLAKK